jgi:hypothetical protein
MKTLASAVALFGFILICMFSCQRDISGGPQPDKPPVVEYVNTSISGRITDDADKPVQGAQVKSSAGSITTTDINGNFRFNNIRVDKNAGFVLVEKDGFFQGSRTIVSRDGSTNYFDIKLIKKTVAGTVSANTGGTVTIANGGTIVFPESGFINAATKTAYTGTVSVSAFFINPEASDFDDIMPGTLRGITVNGEERGLESYGMMAVELTGASNEKLQLADGKLATLNFPIPASLQAQAPASIPLWYFNDSTGLWKEQGAATRQGAQYVGTVSHFSFWNCDWPYPVVDFKVVVKDQNGIPMFPANVKLHIVGTNNISYGYTDSSGTASGKIPVNQLLKLTVMNKCGTALYTADIGPFTSTADAGVITINNANGTQLVITGTVVNCAAAPVTNGFVDVSLENNIYRTAINNGNFSFSFTRCTAAPATATLTAYDLASSVTGSPLNLQVTGGTAAAGQLLACGNTIPEFLNFTVAGAAQTIVPPVDRLNISVVGTIHTVNASQRDTLSKGSRVNMGFYTIGTGTVPLDYLGFYDGSKTYVKQGAININITEYGAVGAYIGGNFSAILKDSFSTATAPVNIVFRVKRTQ